jgi:hypothetical protein
MPGQTATTSAVAVKGPVTTIPQRDWVDYLQVAIVLAAIGSVLLIWRQLRSAARTARQERAAEAAKVWSDREFLSLFSPSWAFLEVQDPEDCIRKVRAWVSARSSEVLLLPPDGDIPIARRNDIKYVIGVIEDVSVRYNRKEIDRDWVERMLAPSLVDTFDQWLWFVTFSRASEGWPSWGAEWERLVRDLRESRYAAERPRLSVGGRRARRKMRRQVDQGTYAEIVGARRQRVRFICLPPDPSHASDHDWANATRLSLALAERESRNDLADIAPENPSNPDAEDRWTAVVIPKSLDSTEEEIERDTALARRIEAYLEAANDLDNAVRDLQEPPAPRIIAAGIAALTVWVALKR